MPTPRRITATAGVFLAATVITTTTAASVSASPNRIPVPPAYAHAVDTAPVVLCGHAVITPDLIARQLRAEAGFRTQAVSAAGAQGPAQLTPRMFAIYGADDDHNGTASPFDVTDAVSAMVRVDCMLTTQLLQRGHPVDTESILAAYTGGIDSVDNPQAREMAHTVLRK